MLSSEQEGDSGDSSGQIDSMADEDNRYLNDDGKDNNQIHDKIDLIQKYIDKLLENVNKNETSDTTLKTPDDHNKSTNEKSNSESLTHRLQLLNESVLTAVQRVGKLEEKFQNKNDLEIKSEKDDPDFYEDTDTGSSDNGEFNINIDPDININECLELLERRIEGNGLLPEQRESFNNPIIERKEPIIVEPQILTIDDLKDTNESVHETKERKKSKSRSPKSKKDNSLRPSTAKPIREHLNSRLNREKSRRRPKTASNIMELADVSSESNTEFMGPPFDSIKKTAF